LQFLDLLFELDDDTPDLIKTGAHSSDNLLDGLTMMAQPLQLFVCGHIVPQLRHVARLLMGRGRSAFLPRPGAKGDRLEIQKGPMGGERDQYPASRCCPIVFAGETTPRNYLKLVASGEVDETMLDALEDYVKRQKKRLGLAQKTEAAN
jgi:hypothetical protein